METVLETYQEDFKEIIDTVERAYDGLPLHLSKPHLEYLYKSLTPQRNGPSLERSDIEQQLCMIWLVCIERYRRNRPKISVRQYLLRLAAWGLRDWFNKQFTFYPVPLIIEDSPETDFKLDLKFLVSGTNFFPLSILSTYERYLIFLKFKEHKSILEISGIVQKNKETVGIQLNRIITNLRREVATCQQEHKKIS